MCPINKSGDKKKHTRNVLQNTQQNNFKFELCVWLARRWRPEATRKTHKNYIRQREKKINETKKNQQEPTQICTCCRAREAQVSPYQIRK